MEALFLFVPILFFIVGLFLVKGKFNVTAEENTQLNQAVELLLCKYNLKLNELELLQIKHARSSQDDPNTSFDEHCILRTVIFRAHHDYYLVIVSSDQVTKKFEKISQLRARRAMFHDKQDYFTAFGEFPNRKQIQELLESLS